MYWFYFVVKLGRVKAKVYPIINQFKDKLTNFYVLAYIVLIIQKYLHKGVRLCES